MNIVEAETVKPETSLVSVRPAGIEHRSPLPVFTGAEMALALTAYRELQTALDRSMPDQIMELDGKPFRKKGYWRAIAVAFGLTVEPIDEKRDIASRFDDKRDNFGYVVTYRATAPNGRSATGDGSCFAVEKARRFKCPHQHPTWKGKTEHWPHDTCPDFDAAFQWRTLPAQATEHNIRSHAHTRAFNRAVSNLVGFGEVSAEEVDRDNATHGYVVEAPTPTTAARSEQQQTTTKVGVDHGVAPSRGDSEPSLPQGVVYITKVEAGRAGGKAKGWLHTSAQLPGSDGFPMFDDRMVGLASEYCQTKTPVRVLFKTSTTSGKDYVQAIKKDVPPAASIDINADLNAAPITVDDIPFDSARAELA